MCRKVILYRNLRPWGRREARDARRETRAVRRNNTGHPEPCFAKDHRRRISAGNSAGRSLEILRKVALRNRGLRMTGRARGARCEMQDARHPTCHGEATERVTKQSRPVSQDSEIAMSACGLLAMTVSSRLQDPLPSFWRPEGVQNHVGRENLTTNRLPSGVTGS
jgi:hypothetical protein